jgi:hypothetical protein
MPKIITIKDISNFKEISISKDGEDFVIQVVYSLQDDQDKEIPNTQKRSSVRITKANEKAKLEAVLALLKPIFKSKEEL